VVRKNRRNEVIVPYSIGRRGQDPSNPIVPSVTVNLRRSALTFALILSLTILTISGRSVTAAEFGFAAPFGNHAVLQCERPVAIWGTGTPGLRITVRLSNGEATAATVSEDGRWQARLPAMRPSAKPLLLTAQQGTTTVSAEDVLIGDVWVVAGGAGVTSSTQTRASAQILSDESKAGDLSHIRAFLVDPRVAADTDGLPATGGWVTAEGQGLAKIGPLGLHFARQLSRPVSRPIGIIQISFPGVRIASWLPSQVVADHPGAEQIRNWRWELERRRARLDAGYLKEVEEYKRIRDRALSAGSSTEGIQVPRRALAPDNPDTPTSVYYGMVRPLQPYSIRGMVWEHGIEDAVRDWAAAYGNLLTAMIEGWRRDWSNSGQSAFPVYIIQLPNYERGDSWAWPVLRDSQRFATQKTEGTGLVVTFGIGDQVSQINPERRTIAGRLAIMARGHAYGGGGVFTGPVYRSMKVEDDTMVLNFDHVGSGLDSRDGESIRHFTIADRYKGFFPAQVEVIGKSQIRVWSQHVQNPVAVRYAWGKAPDGPNFSNREGLYAGPFRTDERELRASR